MRVVSQKPNSGRWQELGSFLSQGSKSVVHAVLFYLISLLKLKFKDKIIKPRTGLLSVGPCMTALVACPMKQNLYRIFIQ